MFKNLVCISVCLALLTPSFAGEVVGWRWDGSGRFPDATPPTKWSADENVVWKTPLPGNGYAAPVVVGDRIVVTSEPAEVIFVAADDGRILWQHTLTINEILGEAKGAEVVARYRQLEEAERKLHRQVKDLVDGDPKREEVKAQTDRLKSQMSDMNFQFPIGRGSSTNACGTPVSDGRRVFVTMGTGIVAAFSLDGEQVWARFVEGTRLGWGHSNSAVLVDGKLVVHYDKLIALDPENGAEIWRSDVEPRYATPLVTTIGDQAVLVLPNGSVVRAKDGVTVGKFGISASECSPVIHDGVVYAHSEGKAVALRLPATANDEFKMERLWETAASRGRRTPSSVYHDGLLYGATTDGVMDVVDAETGEVVYRKRLELNQLYASITVAGDYLFACGTDGQTVVCEPGREFKEVARNQLENSGSCPVFAGNRMYLRARKHLYCISE